MTKYAVDLKTGVVLGGIIDSAVEVDPDTQYFPEGVLTNRPLLIVDGVWDNSLPITSGSVAEGTGLLKMRTGGYVSITGLENYTDAVITSPWGSRTSDGIANDYGWTVPEDGTYYIKVRYLGYRVARLKVVAHASFPYPV